MASPGLFSGLNSFLFGGDEFNQSEQDARNRASQQAQIAEQYRQREYQDYVRQQQLGQYLQRVQAGTAPSAAQGQLVAGQDFAGRQMASQAAGATGVNAGLANYGAILGTGQLSAQTNQQAALLRQKEIADATQAQSGLYQNMGMRSGAMGQSAGSNTLDYTKLGFGIDQSQQEQRNKENGAVMSGIGDAASLYFGGAGGYAAKKQNEYGGEPMDYTPAKA